MQGERIDEAFRWLSELLAAWSDLASDVVDHAAGVRMQLEELGIDTPLELDLRVRAGGMVDLGTAPPLYPVDVTVAPVFHRLRFTALAERRGAAESERHG